MTESDRIDVAAIEHEWATFERSQLVRISRTLPSSYVEIVERVTGRHVTAFASTVTFNPDQAIELFSLAALQTRPPTPNQ